MIAWLIRKDGSEKLLRSIDFPLPPIIRVPIMREWDLNEPLPDPSRLWLKYLEFRLVSRNVESANYEEF